MSKLVAAKGDVKEQIARTGIDLSCVGRWNHDIQENGTVNADKQNEYFALLDTAVSI